MVEGMGSLSPKKGGGGVLPKIKKNKKKRNEGKGTPTTKASPRVSTISHYAKGNISSTSWLAQVFLGTCTYVLIVTNTLDSWHTLNISVHHLLDQLIIITNKKTFTKQTNKVNMLKSQRYKC